MRKPIIGIVAKHYEKDHPKDTVLHESIKRAVFEEGGLGIGIVPACKGKAASVKMDPDERLKEKEQKDLIAQLQLCDGVVLQGGGYNDAYEVFVAKYCYDNDIPILGICAGFYNMLRALGGKSRVMGEMEKDRHAPGKPAGHEITIVSKKLRKITGCERVWVNSRHGSKGILPDKGLVLAAKSDDNMPEAALAPDRRFYLAVQFHPEDLMDQTPMAAIFRSLIREAQRRKA